MKQLVLFPKGSLSASDKGRLAKEGFCAIECEDPSKVVLAVPGAPLVSCDDLLMSAMTGLAYSARAQQEFAADLLKRMKARDRNHVN